MIANIRSKLAAFRVKTETRNDSQLANPTINCKTVDSDCEKFSSRKK